MQIVTDAYDLIGSTPLLALRNVFGDVSASILAKMESCNPTSIKDRAVLNMIRTAMQEGKIAKDCEVVEASSGNTAIAVASLGAVMGYRTRIFMSELCSVERQQIISAYGAKVVLTPGKEHTRGARERAMAYCKMHPDKTFFLNQHGNPNNGIAHEMTTGPELWEQTGGNIDAAVIGLGASGTFVGLSRLLEEKKPGIDVVGFDSDASPVYSGCQ